MERAVRGVRGGREAAAPTEPAEEVDQRHQGAHDQIAEHHPQSSVREFRKRLNWRTTHLLKIISLVRRRIRNHAAVRLLNLFCSATAQCWGMGRAWFGPSTAAGALRSGAGEGVALHDVAVEAVGLGAGCWAGRWTSVLIRSDVMVRQVADFEILPSARQANPTMRRSRQRRFCTDETSDSLRPRGTRLAVLLTYPGLDRSTAC